MSEYYATGLDVVKLKGKSRVSEKSKSIVQLIVDKIAGIDIGDILDPSLIQRVATCIEAAHGKRNRKNKIDKLALLLEILAVVKKTPLTVAEKATVTSVLEFCLQCGLIKGAPIGRLIAINMFRFVKKTLT
jgi:hypothetical protein